VEELLKKWDIGEVDTVELIPSAGGRTSLIKTLDNGCFVLKGRADLVRAEREYDLLRDLSKTELPVALPVTTVDGGWYVVSKEGQAYSLYTQLPGQIITEHYEGDAEKRACAFGKAIGLLHTCLQKCDDGSGFEEMDLVAQVQEWAIPRIREGGGTIDTCAIEGIWQETEPELVSLHSELPRQLIHRDAHPSNMLFEGEELTGFLDFEMVKRGPRVFDVCYCGSSILVGGFEDSEKGQKWPSLFHSLARGYEEFCPLTASERLAMYGVFVTIELVFIAFCLDTHNEDAAKRNESLLYWLATNRDALAM
jgi:Ser/Thr protein kinase RdoA (MazF antagonist)